MNNQTEHVLEAKSLHLQNTYDRSTHIITEQIVFAIVLLAISYLIIQKDLREKTVGKYSQEATGQHRRKQTSG